MKPMIQSSFVDIFSDNDIVEQIGYRYRTENMSFDEANKRVLKKLGFIKTKSGVGIAWTKKTKSTYFLDKKGETRAIYSHTNKTFWWVKQ